MPHCSFPLFRGWIELRFGDLCEAHDAAWMTRVWRDKVVSDFRMAGEMAFRGYPTLALAAFIFWFTLLGTPYWLYKKYKERPHVEETKR